MLDRGRAACRGPGGRADPQDGVSRARRAGCGRRTGRCPSRTAPDPAPRRVRPGTRCARAGCKRTQERVRASTGQLADRRASKRPRRCPAPGCCWRCRHCCNRGCRLTEGLYGRLNNGFFGLRSVLHLAFMALLRITSPEQLKAHAPGELCCWAWTARRRSRRCAATARNRRAARLGYNLRRARPFAAAGPLVGQRRPGAPEATIIRHDQSFQSGPSARHPSGRRPLRAGLGLRPSTSFAPTPSRGDHRECESLPREVDWSHQTSIMTTRRDLATPQVASRMFARWRHENFFRYMRRHFGSPTRLARPTLSRTLITLMSPVSPPPSTRT